MGLLFVLSSQNVFADPVPDPDAPIIVQPNPDNPDAAEPPEDGAVTTDATCYDQVGGIGWLICPVTGTLAKAIDSVYHIIEDLIRVNPISTDQDSPIYLVWEYVRNITNVLFIIFILVVIYSQLTGLGLTNYGIKKVLPRIIIAAILVNLSYIICALAVDVSNVIGQALGSIFTNIYEIATAGETISYSVGEIAGSILGTVAVGAGITIGGLVLAGGIGAALWMLVPVIFAGIVAVVSALITMAARQALIIILIMIAPLAFVAYLLPNTEKLFKKWKDILLQMLIFYPIFAVLFGASQLASWVIISSATNIFGVILGIAVQVLPLFFSFSLMKMSKTILGSISTGIGKLAAPAQKGISTWADSNRSSAKQKHQATSRLPSASLSRYLADRKLRREEDAAKYAETNKLRGQANSAESIYHKDNRLNRRLNRAGTLTNRGQRLYGIQGDNLVNQGKIKKIAGDFDEGYNTTEAYGSENADKRIRNRAQFNRLTKNNEQIISGVDANKLQDARAESIKLSNLESYANRIESARELAALTERTDRTAAEDARLVELQTASNAGRLQAINDTAGALGEKGINNIIASAIAMKIKADHDARDNYNTLFEQTARTKEILARYKHSIQSGNYNEMEAAIDNLATRGDFDLIVEGLVQHGTADNLNLSMQKHLADVLIKYKADSAPLATYAKALNVRRGKAANGQPIDEFISFEDFASGKHRPGDSADIAAGLTLSALLGDIADPVVAATQDRNTFDFILDLAKKGNLQINPNDPETMLGFKLKQIRSAASSGRMDGEQLTNLNALLTGGISSLKMPTDTSDPNYGKLVKKFNETKEFADSHRDAIQSNTRKYLQLMSAGQLSFMKEATFNALNRTTKYLSGEYSEADLIDPNSALNNDEIIHDDIKALLNTAITGVEKPSAAAMRGAMNPEIARKLGLNL